MPALAIVSPPAAPAPTTALTLYALEESLMVLTDTAEMVPAKQEEQFAVELQAALVAAIDKRDRVGQFLAHLEAQAAFGQAEIKRLQERKQMYERTIKRVEEYVIRVIESLGLDARGKSRKLEGRLVTFSLRRCPPSVEIRDESLIPAGYKTVTVTLPVPRWEAMIASLDPEAGADMLESVRSRQISVSKSELKTALESGIEVPGAALITEKKALVRK